MIELPPPTPESEKDLWYLVFMAEHCVPPEKIGFTTRLLITP